jgi:hypothetical protein
VITSPAFTGRALFLQKERAVKMPIDLTAGQVIRLDRGLSAIRFTHLDRAPKEPWPFRNHRTLAQVWQTEDAQEQQA